MIKLFIITNIYTLQARKSFQNQNKNRQTLISGLAVNCAFP
jgi:hypothetical protein